MTINKRKMISKSGIGISILLILLVSCNVSTAQTNCRFAFSDHEKITYNIYYNWGFIWLDAARVYFKTETKSWENKDVFFFEGYGKTRPSYDWIYKVEGSYSTFVETPSLKPLLHHRNTYQAGFEIHNSLQFYHDSLKVHGSFYDSDNGLHKKNIDLKPGSMDVLTATYFVRNLDYSEIQVNDTVPVSIILGGEYFNIYVRYLGKEQIVDRKDRKWDCLKFSALLVAGTIFEGGEDMFVWVTDDENKIPVLVEAKILVGSVKAFLDTWKGINKELIFQAKEN